MLVNVQVLVVRTVQVLGVCGGEERRKTCLSSSLQITLRSLEGSSTCTLFSFPVHCIPQAAQLQAAQYKLPDRELVNDIQPE